MLRCKTLQRSVAVRINCLCGVLAMIIATLFQAQLTLADEFSVQVRPILERYCTECHAADVTEADVDLGAFSSQEDFQHQSDVWVKVRRMLDSGQMPPLDAEQPSDAELQSLKNWVRSFLKREAEASAGDPGPVVLRRLNNEEYNYTVRDLTGIESLNPTREFPVDGAAGEGFINTGSAQSISPSFITKYLDAAKEVAEHVVLLPDGIRFSPYTTRRDQTDELLARIRAFYRKFTAEGTGTTVDLQGIKFDTNQGGVLPLREYLTATLMERDALARGEKSIEAVADEWSLNTKYLSILWKSLSATHANENASSLYLADIRHRWADAAPQDAAKLVALIEAAQQQLWKFNAVGQLTDGGHQKVWMEAASPIVTHQELRFALSTATADSDAIVYLAASDLADGSDGDFVVWQQPRLEFQPDANGSRHPPILLRDLPQLVPRIDRLIATELPRTELYLNAVAKLHAANVSLDQVAIADQLDLALLKQWVALLGLGGHRQHEIHGQFSDKLSNVGGNAGLDGWGFDQTPNMLANQSTEDIRVSTLTVPARGIVMHPSPTRESMVAWRSPISGHVTIAGLVADSDGNCGNGVAWRVELLTEAGTAKIAEGIIDNGGEERFQPASEYHVQQGDVVSLIVNPREGNHACDTTHIALTLTEVASVGAGDVNSIIRKWDLASDTVDRIGEGNPLPDAYGHADTWHFGAIDAVAQTTSALVPESTLAMWRAGVADAQPAEEVSRLAEMVQHMLVVHDGSSLSEADRTVREQLLDWKGPLHWVAVAAALTDVAANSQANKDGTNVAPTGTSPFEANVYGLLAEEFGLHPDGTEIDSASLCVQAPQILDFRLPAALLAGAEFVVSAELHPSTSQAGSVQVQASSVKPTSIVFNPSLPILVSPDSSETVRIEKALAAFRNLFPAALCYARIVPVDEVVTMTLFFREDEQLQRLMLSETQIAELDQLWDELLYVAQEPIALTVAYEQIYQFATQDRPDLVNAFEPMRQPINARGDRFRQRLIDTQPAHVEAVIALADRAWRRPLLATEAESLRAFYSQLRDADIAHEDAIRLTLARIFASPTFLYRHEQPGTGTQAVEVSSSELATRLSYFLWSSMPDDELRQLADSNQLKGEDVLASQTRRMLADARTRRLAIQFACQWLHLRDFDQNDDKNEKLYPEFAALRHDMYEETVLFFEDMFRSDGSILDFIDADHTYLNASLARHYGIEGIEGTEWQRVSQVRQHGRGGVLAMATMLASQSGASRTSPILRGNWVYETLLGQRLPRPPANVPVLPEELLGEMTERQLIELHSSAPDCAKCHVKIDHFGFALEQYDAIGRLRAASVDTKTATEDGREMDGIDGLRDYLLNERHSDVVRQFCRKLLGFALGREVQLSDEPLLDTMEERLRENNYRFHVAVETIVTSDQFRMIRGQSIAPDNQ
ncbi:MAG: DUF1592 domain-containing protein [Pirellulaceae bacterium]|nr:DUF1592 domain-containing protein [Pirellulaceae bacterium]